MLCLSQLKLTNVFSADVVNGQKNAINVAVENKSNRKVTLVNIAGALLNADTNAVIKNVCRALHARVTTN